MSTEELAEKIYGGVIGKNHITPGDGYATISRSFNIDISNKEDQNADYQYYNVESIQQVKEIIKYRASTPDSEIDAKIENILKAKPVNLNAALFMALY